MANRSTSGFGFKAAMRVGNTPSIQGQSKYDIKDNTGVGLFKGNPAALEDSSGDQGFLQDMAFATTDDGGNGGLAYAAGTDASLVGVFNGAFFVDSTTLKPTFANSVAAGARFGTNPNTGSTNGIGFVNDDPFQEYVCKADAAVTQAIKGQCGNVNNFTATDAKDGSSTATLDVGALDETHMFRVVRSAEDPENEDLTAAGANVIVAINSAANLYN